MSAANDSTSNVIIEVRGLVKTFGLRPILRGLNLSVARGECVALLGANGAGKTTLMRTLAALSRPTAGSVTIGGWSLPREAHAVRAQLGVVGHLPLLYNELTASENLRFFAQLYHTPQERIDIILARVGLAKRARDRVGTFSRGMQQRLGIARAILHDPAVLLFDEPYTGLDVDGAAMLDGLIRELVASGHTLIMTSHDLERATLLSQRVVILNRGVIARSTASAGLTSAALSAMYAEVTA